MAPRKIFTISELRDITRMFTKEHKSTGVIGKKYKVSANTIINTLRSSGVEVSLSKIRTLKFTEKQVSTIVKSYAFGLGESMVDLGKRFNCSYATIRRILNENDVYTPDAPAKNKILFSDEEKAKILNDYNEGHSARSISKHFGCNDWVIRAFLRENGVDTRDFGRGKRVRSISDTGTLRTCRSLSRAIYKRHKDFINPKRLDISKCGNHVDHKMSLCEGFSCGLTVLDLAHPVNLQVIPALANYEKYVKSSVTKRELLNAIKAWNKERGDPFSEFALEVKYTYRYGRYKYVSGKYRHFIVHSSKSR